MIATSSHKYNTNSNMEPRKMKYDFFTRSAIRKAKKRKKIRQCVSFTFGLLSILMAAGAPAHIEVEIIEHYGFVRQMCLSSVCLVIAFWAWKN